MFHPASLLLAWLAFALGLQWLALFWLLSIAAFLVVVSMWLATERSLALLRRSRWLLLSLALLYFFMTPGEYLPGLAGTLGMTHEGLRQGMEQIGRLLAMLSSLALLHRHLGTSGLLTALLWLMKPFAWREKTVVRLMLVLETVERRQPISWREWLSLSCAEESLPVSRLTLTMPGFQFVDLASLAILTAVLLALMFLA